MSLGRCRIHLLDGTSHTTPEPNRERAVPAVRGSRPKVLQWQPERIAAKLEVLTSLDRWTYVGDVEGEKKHEETLVRKGVFAQQSSGPVHLVSVFLVLRSIYKQKMGNCCIRHCITVLFEQRLGEMPDIGANKELICDPSFLAMRIMDQIIMKTCIKAI